MESPCIRRPADISVSVSCVSEHDASMWLVRALWFAAGVTCTSPAAYVRACLSGLYYDRSVPTSLPLSVVGWRIPEKHDYTLRGRVCRNALSFSRRGALPSAASSAIA